MTEKQITVTSPLLPDLDELHMMMGDIWEKRWVTNLGEYHQRLEQSLAEYLKVPYISLFTNGTIPLITALQALDIREGEVITTPYSFVATTHSIWWNGLTPVFVDIDPNTCNIDPAKIEKAITPRTVAIMPVHCYGKPCDIQHIQQIADKHGLKVIYDAAHAFGVRVSPTPNPSPVGRGTAGAQRMMADPVEYDLLKENARRMRHEPTDAERFLWQYLRGDQLGVNFRRQHIIMDFIADFVCLEQMLVIEVDGGYHRTEEMQKSDLLRDKLLSERGFRTLRFTNEEVLCDIDSVISIIKSSFREPSERQPSPSPSGEGRGGASFPLRGGQRGAWASILSAGDISTLSFHATKVFNTLEGGALVCQSEEMKRKIDYLRNFGFEDETEVVGPGINGKVDEVRSAYGLLNLRLVDAAIEARHQVAIRYRKALRDMSGIRFFDDMPGVRHNYSYFPIFVNESEYGLSRDELYFKLKEHNILGRRYFYPLISTFGPYSILPSASPENLPVATRMANEVICLPMHHALSEEDVNRVIDVVLNKR